MTQFRPSIMEFAIIIVSTKVEGSGRLLNIIQEKRLGVWKQRPPTKQQNATNINNGGEREKGQHTHSHSNQSNKREGETQWCCRFGNDSRGETQEYTERKIIIHKENGKGRKRKQEEEKDRLGHLKRGRGPFLYSWSDLETSCQPAISICDRERVYFQSDVFGWNFCVLRNSLDYQNLFSGSAQRKVFNFKIIINHSERF